MNVAHVVSVSGGKDSTATYCRAIERGRPFRAVAADTGNEHPATYEAVNRLHERTGGPKVEWVKADFSRRIAKKRMFIEKNWEAHGVPADLVERALSVLHPTGNPFLDLCLWKGRFPSRKAQFCTQELKVEPIDGQVTRPLLATGTNVISWQGVRAAESEARKHLPPVQRIVTHDDLPGRFYVYRPLLRVESVEEVFGIAARHGVPANPLYGWGLKRVGCFPCINCAKAELALVDSHFPEQIDRLEEWERLVTDASKRGHATFFAIVNDPVMCAEWEAMERIGVVPSDMAAAGFGIRRMVEWAKTDRGGRQYSLFARDNSTVCSQWGACE
ncbi:phosphoadenosine phosphosulfate reductase family protein [Nitratireductor aquimarinus]|uniref:phosphoadenosine phosphosulfate reductase domain-containing protein n=1 Tax=Nitratireductor TaxID=245876 RepID=UPI0019D34F1D|nr:MULTISPECIES: phosphoadenosine phosphosulfate reductase family protein [Nitratireductor]MBN7777754.1 phosphoadenosine phosphosulfate reductase family protein [Nitratireductor pacificus]MBN7781748.1 phosphoadenosine phosphosulfate reductase family protein [Nitratireductor pacificus]MBN7790554.1 phosphoadenosine phosphosulfate reductase family protein [Nitratireductor aquimarinus]MBY6099964.1 phosphoadenosine phosphosulfate reductase family protein [Nitratireductor aquimarinus]MCA1260430.1 ph